LAWLDGFAVATALLTRVPVAAPMSPGSGQVAAAGWAFPLVGAGIGLVVGLVFLVASLLGLGSWPAALLGLAAGMLLTGALHEDGFADTLDGLGGGRDPAAKLAIMRDSRLGVFGGLALFLSVGLRAAALAGIAEPVQTGLALIAAHAGSRALLPAVLRRLPPARADGLGAAAGRPSRVVVAVAAAIATGLVLTALGPRRGGVAIVVAVVTAGFAVRLARRQIGGYTGDVLGAVQQLGEIAILLVAAAH
jgi:adenosylcobinamide-GDP ribazoletransferase